MYLSKAPDEPSLSWTFSRTCPGCFERVNNQGLSVTIVELDAARNPVLQP